MSQWHGRLSPDTSPFAEGQLTRGHLVLNEIIALQLEVTIGVELYSILHAIPESAARKRASSSRPSWPTRVEPRFARKMARRRHLW